ncbi:MAG: LytR C-terminal domain-containing protein [Fusobacteriaceae bacterium]
MRKRNKILYGVGVIFSVIVFLVVFFVKSINSNNSDVKNFSKYVIIGKGNLIVIYEEKLAIKIPYEIQVDKTHTFGEMVKLKNYDKVLETINGIFPEKIDAYKIVKFGNIEIDVKNQKNIPEMLLDEKRYILTSSVYAMFRDYYKGNKEQNATYKDIIIDILNAKGTSGYARKVGEKLKKVYGVKYNAANFEKNEEESFIVLNDGISKENVEKLIMELDENYLKIKNTSSMPTLASAVFGLGKEDNISTKIKIIGKEAEINKVEKSLKKNDYKNISLEKTTINVKESSIEYSEEDYFIAYKIGKKIGINNLIEKNEDKNIIKIKLGQ